MKKVITIMGFIMIFMVSLVWGQSSPGDIAFIAYNADGGDDFAFVTLVNIPASATIYFTDNEWNGTAFADLNEGEIEWTNGGTQLDAGSVVVFTDPINGGGSVNVGSHTGNGWNLGASDEWIYALIEAPATSYGTPPTFLAAMASDAGSGWLTGTGLTEGTNAIDFNDDNDGYKYTGSRSGEASFEDYLPLIINASNWQIETSDGELILPISTTAFTETGGGTPSITLSESSLTGFSYYVGSGPSAEQTFTAQGSDLTANISIAATTNYEISTGSGGSFVATNPIILTQSGGSVAETTIYVRLKSGLSAGEYNSEDISATSTDASTRTVTCSGEVYKLEPTNHVTSFTATADGFNKIDLSWTENDGAVVPDGYLIKASTSDNVSNPSDGTPVFDNTTIGNDSGAKNISHGTTAYEWTGLTAESTYYFKIYPYTNSGSVINYKTDGTVPSANATTDPMPEIPDILISEVADPSDVANAKFVELYNASGSGITFDTDWFICRQSNGDSWSDVELIGTISAGGTFVIAYNQGTYESTYPSPADQYSGSISGNGDDGYFLYYGSGHATGTLIDAYGVIDQDGTSQDWEYTDGHAVRNAGVTEPNSTWTSSEWTITSATAAQCTPGISTLPVTLSTFTAQYLNSKPTLYWQTQSEEDNMGWFIYRNTIEDFTSAEKISGMIQGHGTTTQPQSYIYEDAEQLQVEQTYFYWLESVDYSGTIHHFDMVANVTIPHTNDPGQNITPPVAYEITADPNPFSQTTEITFAMSQTSLVDVAIYNLKGQLVKSFDTVMTNADEDVSFQWNGKDNSGKSLSNGVYLYSVKVNGKDYATKQLILMK